MQSGTFSWRKDIDWENLSYTLNTTECFLETFEKSFSKTWGFVRISQPNLSFIFSKSQLFSLFLIYNLISWSWGHHVFSRCKNPVWPNRSDILNMFIKPGECFLEEFEKNVLAQKWGFLKIFQTCFDLAFLLTFFGWTLSNASRIFSVEFKKMLKISERFD